MWAKYLKTQDFLTCTKKQTDSLVWKRLVNYRQLLRKEIVWKAGKGTEMSFWHDNWIEPQSLVELVGLDEGMNPDPNIRVSEFIQNAQWDI